MQHGRPVFSGVIDFLDRVGVIALVLTAAALVAALWHNGTALEARAWMSFHAALWGAVGVFCVARCLDMARILRRAPAARAPHPAAGPEPGSTHPDEPGLHRAA